MATNTLQTQKKPVPQMSVAAPSSVAPPKPKVLGQSMPLSTNSYAPKPVQAPAMSVAPKMSASPAATSVKPAMSVAPPKPAMSVAPPKPAVPTPAQQVKAVSGFQAKLDASDPAAIGGSMMRPQTTDRQMQELADRDPEEADRVMDSLGYSGSPNDPNRARDSQIEALRRSYLDSMSPSEEERGVQSQLDEISSRQAMLRANAEAGKTSLAERPVEMGFVTGQQAAVERRLQSMLGQEAAQAVPLQAKLASFQAQQEQRRKMAEAELGFADKDREFARELEKERRSGSKPIEVGGVLVDPVTFKPVYSPKQGPIELSEGSTLFDPESGEAIYTAPKTYKPTGSGDGLGGNPGSLSSLAKSVYDNPALLNTLTPTVKGKILSELSGSGMDVSRFGLQNLGGTQREQVALFDEIENEANFARDLYGKGVNTGPLASRLGTLGQKFGTTGQDFTNLNSAVSNMGSILLRMRSGAAVTPQEFERIAGFIPSINESEKTAKDKIARFFAEISAAKENYIKRQTQSTYDIVSQPQSGFGTSSGLDPLGIL